MASDLIVTPFRPVINLSGGLASGAKLFVYRAGTTTLEPIYSDETLTTLLSNPVVADSFGVLPAIYYDNAKAVRLILKDANNTTLFDVDPYIPTVASIDEALDTVALSTISSAESASEAAAQRLLAEEANFQASLSAASAAQSATTAILAPGTSATSTTLHDVGTGVKIFFINEGKQFARGQFVTVTSNTDPTRWMFGRIENNATGNIKLDINVTGSSLPNGGTYNDWTIALSGPAGSVGTIDIVSATTGTLPANRGGTGNTSFTANRLIRGNGTSALAVSGIADFSTSEALRVTSGNNVGIGTTTPGTKLDVRGVVRSETSGAYIDLNHDGVNGSLNSSSALLLYAGGANHLIMHTNGTERVRVTSAGNIGIGTNSPSEVLHVEGNIRDTLGNVRNIFKSSETSGTLTVASANKRIRATGNITVPSAVFSDGNTLLIINKSGGAITITQGSGLTLTDAEGNTGNRTLDNHGIATIIFDSGTVAEISGAGLS